MLGLWLVAVSTLGCGSYETLSPQASGKEIDLGLSAISFDQGKIPNGWHLRRRLFGPSRRGSAMWVIDDGKKAVRLHSKAALTFLERRVDINIHEYQVVSWQWKVENVLQENDERTVQGDDHPIRLFFVFEPEESRQSWWFRLRRVLYLDWFHGHPIGGRFTEYLWSSYLEPGSVIQDPGKPWQKLMVVEGGTQNLGRWRSYERNLYEDLKQLYGEEPGRLVFVGILNDTDQTGQEATSYLADLIFRKPS